MKFPLAILSLGVISAASGEINLPLPTTESTLYTSSAPIIETTSAPIIDTTLAPDNEDTWVADLPLRTTEPSLYTSSAPIIETTRAPDNEDTWVADNEDTWVADNKPTSLHDNEHNKATSLPDIEIPMINLPMVTPEMRFSSGGEMRFSSGGFQFRANDTLTYGESDIDDKVTGTRQLKETTATASSWYRWKCYDEDDHRVCDYWGDQHPAGGTRCYIKGNSKNCKPINGGAPTQPKKPTQPEKPTQPKITSWSKWSKYNCYWEGEHQVCDYWGNDHPTSGTRCHFYYGRKECKPIS